MISATTIPGTDLAMSQACLGTMTFGDQADEAAAAAMLDFCLERGVNFVDTANVYNAGRSEEILGRILRGRRDRIVLASKVGIKTGDAADQQGLSPAAIRRGIEESLRRLRTDRLDFYYLHQPDYATPLEESLAAMEALVRQGKVRFLGASNYASWQVCRLLWLAERNGWPPVRLVQPMYNLIARGAEQELLPMCREFALPVVCYNPLAGGLLTGKHQRAAAVPGSRFERNPAYRDRYWHEANFAAVDRLADIARAADTSLTGLSLRWLFHHVAADGVVLGASRLEQIRENLALIDQGPLPDDSVAACDEVWKQLRGVSPPYHR